MKLLYATSIKYPSALANRIQAVSMAKAFGSSLQADFYFGGNEIKTDLPHSHVVNFGVKKSWKLAWRVLKFVKEEHVSVIYCREARLLFFIAFYNFVFFRLPLRYGYEVHALLGRSTLDYITDAALRFSVYRYFFLTHALQKIYSEKYRIKKERTMVTPDAVDPSIFDISISKEVARKQLGLPMGTKIVGFCGQFKTLSMDKGIDDILSALKMLPEEISFVAVGGNTGDVEEYQKKSQTLGVSSRATFLGHVSQSELAVWQKAFDILLMPFPWQNHYAYYMSPLKMFEYMAACRPIIATDLPSTREILNGENALVVPPDAPERIRDAVLKIYADTALRDRLSLAAYADSKKYTWGKRAEKITSFLRVE